MKNSTLKAGIFALAVAGSLLVAAGSASPASATDYNTNSKECSVHIIGKSHKLGQSDSQFYKSGDDTVSAKVVVKGDDDCKKTVTIASWKAPYGKKNYLPIKDQKLFTSKTWHLKKGKHELTIKHADCLYQIDMLYGKAVTTPQGTAEYPDSQKLGWVFGGNEVCHPPVKKPAPEPEIPEKPVALPESGANTVGIAALFTSVTAAGTAAYRFALKRRITR